MCRYLCKVLRAPLPSFFTSPPLRHSSNWYCTCFDTNSYHITNTGFFLFFENWHGRKVSVCGWNSWRQYQLLWSTCMKHEKRVDSQNAAVQVVTGLVLGVTPLYLDYCKRRCPPVVGSEGGSQSDTRLSFLQAGGRVHAASATGARVQRESSGLIVLKDNKHTVADLMNEIL